MYREGRERVRKNQWLAREVGATLLSLLLEPLASGGETGYNGDCEDRVKYLDKRC